MSGTHQFENQITAVGFKYIIKQQTLALVVNSLKFKGFGYSYDPNHMIPDVQIFNG